MDGVPRLDIRRLRRMGGLWPGGITPATIEWTRHRQMVASIDLRIDLRGGETGQAVIDFDFDGQPVGQVIDIVSRPMPYGGRRYYFICPRHGRRCEVLALVGGHFASRQAHRLTYQSQSDDLLERLRGRRDRLWGRLRPEGRQGARGQNGERLFEAFCNADHEYERLFDRAMQRLDLRIRRLDAIEEAAVRRAEARRAKMRPAWGYPPLEESRSVRAAMTTPARGCPKVGIPAAN